MNKGDEKMGNPKFIIDKVINCKNFYFKFKIPGKLENKSTADGFFYDTQIKFNNESEIIITYPLEENGKKYTSSYTIKDRKLKDKLNSIMNENDYIISEIMESIISKILNNTIKTKAKLIEKNGYMYYTITFESPNKENNYLYLENEPNILFTEDYILSQVIKYILESNRSYDELINGNRNDLEDKSKHEDIIKGIFETFDTKQTIKNYFEKKFAENIEKFLNVYIGYYNKLYFSFPKSKKDIELFEPIDIKYDEIKLPFTYSKERIITEFSFNLSQFMNIIIDNILFFETIDAKPIKEKSDYFEITLIRKNNKATFLFNNFPNIGLVIIPKKDKNAFLYKKDNKNIFVYKINKSSGFEKHRKLDDFEIAGLWYLYHFSPIPIYYKTES